MSIYNVFHPYNPNLYIDVRVDEVNVPDNQLSYLERAFISYKERLDSIYSKISQAVDPLLQQDTNARDILEPV